MVYDLESSASIGLFFGKHYDVNIAKVIQPEFVFGFAWKYLGERKVHSCYVWDFPLYKKDPKNDIEVIKKWRELMLVTDIIVGHNSDQFDNKMMVGRMIKHRLPPVPLPQSVDTKKAIKRVARFNSNKLDDLGETFNIGRKMQHEGIELWWACMLGDTKAQDKMVKYNIQDVRLTEKLYLVELPYMAAHPNQAIILNRPNACPKCGAVGHMQAAGLIYTGVPKQRWLCKACGAYSRSRRGDKELRPSDYV